MRKFQALSLSAALLASLLLGGCANNAASSDAASSDSAASEPEATPEPTPAPPAANPLTGAADADYTGKRPVAVTLRNMTGSTPQWGIASADVLVEGVTEGTTASLMALYANPDSIAKAGPVGPARDLLLQVALPLNAVPVHIDKNIYASNLLNTLAYQDLDGYHIGKTAFAFDQDRQNAGYAEENCWYTTAELINSGLASYGVSLNGDNTPLFQFGERPAVDPADRSGMNLTITFSPDDIDCLNYDTGTGLYALSNGDGSPVQDADNGQQVGFTNVFVFYASSGIKDDGYTRQYDMTAGTGLYLHGGAWERINWTKEDATGPFAITNEAGETLVVSQGKSFIAIWGGYYGQSISLTAADGSAQTLPDKPALLESGISEEAAAAAEADYNAAQEAASAETELARAQAELPDAQAALEEAQTALDADPENQDLITARDNAQANVDALTAILSAAEQQDGQAEYRGFLFFLYKERTKEILNKNAWYGLRPYHAFLIKNSFGPFLIRKGRELSLLSPALLAAQTHPDSRGGRRRRLQRGGRASTFRRPDAHCNLRPGRSSTPPACGRAGRAETACS